MAAVFGGMARSFWKNIFVCPNGQGIDRKISREPVYIRSRMGKYWRFFNAGDFYKRRFILKCAPGLKYANFFLMAKLWLSLLCLPLLRLLTNNPGITSLHKKTGKLCVTGFYCYKIINFSTLQQTFCIAEGQGIHSWTRPEPKLN